MLHVQEYLKNGKTLDDLHNELAIKITHHPELPLVILNYDQLDSPKTNKIVQECRGLVLEKDTFALISKSFNRFFNLGECLDEMPNFNWNSFTTQEKVDGSLVNIYNYKGKWFANTRGSFGLFPILNNDWEAEYHNIPKETTWQDAFCKALNINNIQELELDPTLSYICEFCSPWNKVVRHYPNPVMYQLTTFKGEQELGPIQHKYFQTLNTYDLNSTKEIQDYVNSHPEAAFEGVVIKDDKNNRWKIKNARYLALSRIKGNNSEELSNPKNLVPYILQGEDEILIYYPEITKVYNSYKEKVNEALTLLLSVYENAKHIENQKEFALAIQGKTPFTSILFNARKKNVSPKEIWRDSESSILKVIFNK